MFGAFRTRLHTFLRQVLRLRPSSVPIRTVLNGSQSGIKGRLSARSNGQTAVRRFMNKGARLIPQGPDPADYVKHRIETIQECPDLAVVLSADLYDEYLDMCRLGGWLPLGRNTFIRGLRRLGYEAQLVTTATGDRAKGIDFSRPAGNLAVLKIRRRR